MVRNQEYLYMSWISKSIPLIALTILGLVVATIPISIAMGLQQEKRHFRTVREGFFYRSGQMTVPGLARTVHDLGIKTVITLRDGNKPDDPPPDLAEENWCRQNGLNYHRFRPLAWEGFDGSPAPVESNISKYLKVLGDYESYPIMLHCFAGIHRTGTYAAIYRMEVEHWPLEKAVQEMRACGYTQIENDLDLCGFIMGYRPGERMKALPATISRDSMLIPVSGLSNAFNR